RGPSQALFSGSILAQSNLSDRVLGKRSACLAQGVGPLSRIDVAVRINRNTFTRGTLTQTVLALEGLDESGHVVVVDVADAYPVTPAGMVGRAGLGVDGVEHVILGDEQPADAAEGIAGFQVVAFLVEDLDAVIAAIGHPQATLGIEFHRMRGAELTVTRADLSPLLDEGAIG